MKGVYERVVASNCCSSQTNDNNLHASLTSDCSESGSHCFKSFKGLSLSGFFSSAISIFETDYWQSACEKGDNARNIRWTSSLRKIMSTGSMRRIHECVLGSRRSGLSSVSDVWLLGVRYEVSLGEESTGLAGFYLDFSSRILITYRKGFDAIGNSSLTSDVNWGCMIRSSQMLVVQALVFHHLGRSWRKPPCNEQRCCGGGGYAEILQLFGDSEMSAFSIHNLVRAGEPHGLEAGSWVGPYTVCRSWESLSRGAPSLKHRFLLMAVYVVSGDEDGERGGAPVLYVPDVVRRCLEFSDGEADWAPVLLLIPLVLGLDELNPRYIPSLRETFTFPQSVGIMGGRPGASTYIIGVQDDVAFYLDPHCVQPVVCVNGDDDAQADTSSYHCNTIQHVPLGSLDPSLAIGFYCRDKDSFDDFCHRATNLAESSAGAPLFTVALSRKSQKPTACFEFADRENDASGSDEWQLV